MQASIANAHASDVLTRQPGRVLCGAVVVLLMVAYAVPYAWSTLPSDTVRDLLQARAIARGEHFPLVGPPINFSAHLGPAWWYLAALPLVFASSTVGAMVFIGALAAAKFPLAYACGTRLVSRRFGLCFAVALALPSVAIFQWVLPMHPALVEAALLLSLACALRCACGGGVRWAYAAALALGLAVQFHPTALFYVPLLAAWLLSRRQIAPAQRFAQTAVAMLAVSIWFLPALWSSLGAAAPPQTQWSARAPDATGDLSLASLANVANALFVELPYAIAGSHLSTSGRPGIAALLLLAVIGVALAAGGLRVLASDDRSSRRRTLVVGALFVAALSIAATMRSYVSFYTVYFLLPLFAYVAAASLDSLLASRVVLLRLLGAAGLAATLVVHAASAWRAVQHGRDAFLQSALPSLGDLRNGEPTLMRASLYPVGTRDIVGHALCRATTDVTLHGDLAYRDAASFSLDTLLACDRAIRPMIGGQSPPLEDAHRIGLSRGLLRKLGREPDAWLGDIGIVGALAIAHPRAGPRAAPEFSYFEPAPDRGDVETLSLALEAEEGATVAIYNYKPFDSRLRTVRMMANGAPVMPLMQTVEATFYRVPLAMPGPVRWTMSIETDVPQWIDVFAF